MGNNCCKKYSYYARSRNRIIGKAVNCPKCNKFFHSKTTFASFNMHLDHCLTVFSPPLEIFSSEANLANLKYDDFDENIIFWIKNANRILEKKVFKKLEKNEYNNIISLSCEEIKNKHFLEKQCWFYAQIEQLKINWKNGCDTLEIRKEFLLEDTIQNLVNCNLHKELKIKLKDDKVSDAGGLIREWIYLLMNELILKNRICVPAKTDEILYKLNHEMTDSSAMNNDGLYKLFGILLGKALIEKIPINFYFNQPFLKSILGEKMCLEDILLFDRELYNSWSFLKKNSLSNEDATFFNFEILCNKNNQMSSYELKENGINIQVDDSNKLEYIDLCIEFYTEKQIKKELDLILTEIYKIVPKFYLDVFTINEFELILNGISTIDLNDWRQNTIYKGIYNETHYIIKWFWEYMEKLDPLQLSRFLKFSTGNSRTPFDGFRNLMSNRGNISKFCIESCNFDKNKSVLVMAHTCFNRIDVPLFNDQKDLVKALDLVVNSDTDGIFGLE